MDKRVRQGLDQGIREFNEGAFFEAHDTLEDTWMDVRGGNRLFFQGLIQLSIGYYHLTCVNYKTGGLPAIAVRRPTAALVGSSPGDLAGPTADDRRNSFCYDLVFP